MTALESGRTTTWPRTWRAPVRLLARWAAWRAKEKAETERYRTRARGAFEEARGEESGAEAGAEAEGSRGGGRGRGEGTGGRGGGGSRRQAKLCPSAPQGHEQTAPRRKGGPRRTEGSGVNPRGPRTAGRQELHRSGLCSGAVENWQTCRGATPLRGSVGDPRDAADTTVAPCEFSRRLAT